jgi:murein DD-endopeptidase MepM/ murein hydrolase activator NlpD
VRRVSQRALLAMLAVVTLPAMATLTQQSAAASQLPVAADAVSADATFTPLAVSGGADLAASRGLVREPIGPDFLSPESSLGAAEGFGAPLPASADGFGEEDGSPAALQPGATPPTPAATPAAARLKSSVRWVRPNRGSISSPFGMRWGRMHEGVDLAGGYGSPILAASDGFVLYAGSAPGYGRVVKIREPDGTETWYGHMSRFLTKAGDHVKAGQLIALVGAAGDATGPHLHFEVHVGGRPVDPVPFLRAHGAGI